MSTLPLIDVTPLRERSLAEQTVAAEIDAACRAVGFFRITGHGVPSELGSTILEWMERVTSLAHAVMRGVALGLGLHGDWFQQHLTADPTVLFRIFHYPPGDSTDWGVGEHTDYGLLRVCAAWGRRGGGGV